MTTPLLVDDGTGPRHVDLESYLDPDAEERAQDDARRWIKAIRQLRVDDVPFRRRFALRGDSLWWFAELFLHREQAILSTFRTIGAFDALVAAERPLTIDMLGAAWPAADVIAAAARARGVRLSGRPRGSGRLVRRARLEARAAALAWGATLSRLRARRVPGDAADVAAFVHAAFWQGDVDGGRAESYIGPVLAELERRTSGGIAYVELGPSRNFRARRWWDPFRPRSGRSTTPIERFAPASRLAEARRVWRERRRTLAALTGSEDLRRHATIRGCDCWAVVEHQLAGIAFLQFPWSARAMDEAGAALDALRPRVCVTYAEAGGWGRALAIECRRRGIPLAGLQHGFIYRHWLNYRHDADEMQPDPESPADRGFPRPSVTLLFDAYAARHLVECGRFPASSLAVTGSPRLDDLIASIGGISEADRERTRVEAGAGGGRPLVLLATKYKEAAGVVSALVDAVRSMPEVQLAIKPHPAETADPYRAAAAKASNVRVLDATAPLAPLLAAARAIVTVNSTVALDALVLGVPAIVLGLPNNLSPFVDAGVMLGASGEAAIVSELRRVLYDQEFRRQFERATRAFTADYVGADGGAAARAAAAVLDLQRQAP